MSSVGVAASASRKYRQEHFQANDIIYILFSCGDAKNVEEKMFKVTHENLNIKKCDFFPLTSRAYTLGLVYNLARILLLSEKIIKSSRVKMG